jgi:MerR family transcriptional regulator, copper efflux regulator
MKTSEKLMRVGELAKAVRKTVRAMHLYEEMGLLRPVSRSAGGYRLYTEEAKSRVQWITRMQELGFSLPEVQAFLKSWESSDNGPQGMVQVRAVFEGKLAETRAQLARLAELERELQASLAYLDLCGQCAPSHKQDDCGCCEQPGHDPQTTPELVSGLAKPHTLSRDARGSAAANFDVPLGHLITEGR